MLTFSGPFGRGLITGFSLADVSTALTADIVSFRRPLVSSLFPQIVSFPQVCPSSSLHTKYAGKYNKHTYSVTIQYVTLTARLNSNCISVTYRIIFHNLYRDTGEMNVTSFVS